MSMQEADRASAAVATEPRVALADIEAAISERYDFVASDAVQALGFPTSANTPHPLSVLSVCILVMRNGFTVIGKSAPASPANFNADLGRKFAYDDAIRQLWPLMGFALREKLAAGHI